MSRLRSSDQKKWEEEEREIRQNPSDDEGDIGIIIFIAVIVALGFIFSGIGLIFSAIDNLILKHWIIGGFIFLILFRYIWRRPKTNILIKIVIILYCIYGIFTAFTGYKMSTVIDNWIGEYKLVDKNLKFDDIIDDSTKPKKKKKKRTQVVIEQAKTLPSFTNSSLISIQQENIINFNDTKFNIEPIEYHKHFQRVVTGGNYERYPVSIRTIWTDLNNNKKKYYSVNMVMIKDTLNISLYGDKYFFGAKYIKVK